MPPHTSEHEKMEAMLKKNAELLEENNKILKRIHRYGVMSFWFRLLWYALIIGFPFAVYFYVLEPYFAAFGSSYENFLDGMNELPGFRGISELFGQSE